MSGKYTCILREGEELLPDTLQQELGVSARKIGPSDSFEEKGVA